MPPSKKKTPKPRYRHLISGAIGDRPHEPGDLVAVSVPPAKIKEWLAAGIIEPKETADD